MVLKSYQNFVEDTLWDNSELVEMVILTWPEWDLDENYFAVVSQVASLMVGYLLKAAYQICIYPMKKRHYNFRYSKAPGDLLDRWV